VISTDRLNLKAIGFIMAILFLFGILGMAVVKMNTAVQDPPDTRTAEQKLDDLESSPGAQSPGAQGFINTERSRREATKAAEDAALGK
jgi:CHASE3 domain sensor protein